MEFSDRLTELWTIVRRIPRGRCTSYGEVGRAMSRPVSGFLIGKWMTQSPEGVPWWRVVLKSGGLATYKVDPRIGAEQRERLESEGIPFKDENVDMPAVHWEP